jgi:hypothetical protein
MQRESSVVARQDPRRSAKELPISFAVAMSQGRNEALSSAALQKTARSRLAEAELAIDYVSCPFVSNGILESRKMCSIIYCWLWLVL